MASPQYISTQRLFAVITGLKVLAAFAGWWFKSPIGLGMILPLLFMAIYILVGYWRRDPNVTLEKFADSCYYLGFIFTIVSIVVCLFDIKSIGNDLSAIAFRFGAAMASTVIGLGVRVYLVTFRRDAFDANTLAEDALIRAVDRYTAQLGLVHDRLKSFHEAVDNATRQTIARVDVAMEDLISKHSEKVTEFLNGLTEKQASVTELATTTIAQAADSLAGALHSHGAGLAENLRRFEDSLERFSKTLDQRLKNTAFPDDIFSRAITPALASLTDSIEVIAQQAKQLASGVSHTSRSLNKVISRLDERATALEGAVNVTCEAFERHNDSVLRSAAILEGVTQNVRALEDAQVELARSLTAVKNEIAGLSALWNRQTDQKEADNVVSDGDKQPDGFADKENVVNV